MRLNYGTIIAIIVHGRVGFRLQTHWCINYNSGNTYTFTVLMCERNEGAGEMKIFQRSVYHTINFIGGDGTLFRPFWELDSNLSRDVHLQQSQHKAGEGERYLAVYGPKNHNGFNTPFQHGTSPLCCFIFLQILSNIMNVVVFVPHSPAFLFLMLKLCQCFCNVS